jgi:heptosyltransferase I
VRLSALGDVIMMLPLVHTLRQALPQAEITWLIGDRVFPLVEGLAGVRLIPITKPRHWRDYAALRQQLAAESFDVVLCLQASLRTNLIYPLLRAPVKIGFDYARARDGQWLFTTDRVTAKREHLVESFLGFLTPLAIRARTIGWDLPVPNDASEWAQHIRTQVDAERMLVVNPCASKPERNWPVANYINLLQTVQSSQSVHIVLTGGPSIGEKTWCQLITDGLRGAVTNLAGKTSHKQLAAILAEADCVLAPDTGPVHIAVAVGTPVVGLYAVAPPELSGPYGQRDWIVNRFPEAVRMFLHRDPNDIPWGTRVHDARAMTLITVADVREKLELALRAKPPR